MEEIKEEGKTTNIPEKTEKPVTKLKETEKLEKVVVAISVLRVREKPSNTAAVKDTIKGGEVIEVEKRQGGWIKVKDGWVRATHTKPL